MKKSTRRPVSVPVTTSPAPFPFHGITPTVADDNYIVKTNAPDPVAKPAAPNYFPTEKHQL